MHVPIRLNPHRLAVACLLAGCLHAQSANPLPYFTITDLGVLPGTQASVATGISSNGIVSGYSSTVASGAEAISGTGFLHSSGTMTPLQDGSNAFTVPIGVNASGQAVGLTGNYSSRQMTPFLFQSGQFQIPANLPNDPSGNSITLLTGINDSGTIVGNVVPQHSGGASMQPFFWSNGTATNLPFAFATAINASGSISGWSGTIADQNLTALIWSNAQKSGAQILTLSGASVGCGAPGTSSCSFQAVSLSNAGQAMTNVYYGSTYASSGFFVFPFTGGQASGGGGLGIGVNSNGWTTFMEGEEGGGDFDAAFAPAGISGDMFSEPVTGMEAAIIAWPFSMYFGPGSASGPALTIMQTTPTGGISETGAPLNELVVNGSGWYLSYVAAINDAGQIVGTGFHNGQQRAFLLTPGATAPTGPSIDHIAGGGLSMPPITSITTGGWFSVFGFDFLPLDTALTVPNGVGLSAQDIVAGSLPTNLYQTCVEVNGAKSALDYVSPTQLNVQAPEVTPGTTASVVVVSNCGTANEIATAPLSVSAAALDPEFLYFTQNHSGQNPIAAVNALTGAVVNFSVFMGEVHPGDSLTLFAVGLGATTPAQIPGMIATQAATVNGSVSVSIGDISASVSYAGTSPGSSGLYQINLIVPPGLGSGNQPVSMIVNGTPAPAGGYLTIQ